jgi:hypothetical protein
MQLTKLRIDNLQWKVIYAINPIEHADEDLPHSVRLRCFSDRVLDS